MARNPRFHRRGNAERLVNPAEIVVYVTFARVAKHFDSPLRLSGRPFH